MHIYAGVAQLVEQRIRNAQVVGSSPTTSFKVFASCGAFVFILFCDKPEFAGSARSRYSAGSLQTNRYTFVTLLPLSDF